MFLEIVIVNRQRGLDANSRRGGREGGGKGQYLNHDFNCLVGTDRDGHDDSGLARMDEEGCYSWHKSCCLIRLVSRGAQLSQSSLIPFTVIPDLPPAGPSGGGVCQPPPDEES